MPEPHEGKVHEELGKAEKELREREQKEHGEIEKDARQKGADLEKNIKGRFGHHGEEQPQSQTPKPPDKP